MLSVLSDSHDTNTDQQMHWSEFIVFKAPWKPSDSDREGATGNTTEDEMEKSGDAHTQSQRASAPRQ